MSSALGWGLRRYAWLVLLFMVGIGVLIPFWQSRAADVYESRAYVGPASAITLPNLDPLPRIGETQFNDGAVAASVRSALGLGSTASVIPARAELIAAQDNPLFIIVGRASTPSTAQHIAEVAASAFVIEMNKLGETTQPGDKPAVGSFSVMKGADLPVKPVPHLPGGKLALLFGLAGGAVAGVGAVVLIVVLRRPVVDAATAAQATQIPLFGRVTLLRGRALSESDVRGVAPIGRRLLLNPVDVVLVTSPPRIARQRQIVSQAIASVAGRTRRTELTSHEAEITASFGKPVASSRGGSQGRTRLRILDDPSEAQMAVPLDKAMILFVAPEGIAAKTLREGAEDYQDIVRAGLILVRSRRIRRSFARRTAPAPARDESTSHEVQARPEAAQTPDPQAEGESA